MAVENAELFFTWRGSLRVCGGILDKLSQGRLDPEAYSEAYGAVRSLLHGAGSAAAELEARAASGAAALATALSVVSELRAIVARQRVALSATGLRALPAPLTAAQGAQADKRETEAERALRSRVAMLEDALAAEREATRIARVVCETLQRKAGRAEEDAANARTAADLHRRKNRSLERIVYLLEKSLESAALLPR
mmetsp:Transcript_8658/g.26054  ORF Transcript_8658/g.26054 Transcript_8658/m.26054 type:complete len:196 (-) Transcript_8658:24-611(-)